MLSSTRFPDIAASKRARLATDLEPGTMTEPETGLPGACTMETNGLMIRSTIDRGTPMVLVSPTDSPIRLTATMGTMSFPDV